MGSGIASIGRWHYSAPTLVPDKNGETVIFSRASVAPAEVFEWGLRTDRRPFERYRWCEDDFYRDSDYDRAIPAEELLRQMEAVASELRAYGFAAAAEQYDEIRRRLASG